MTMSALPNSRHSSDGLRRNLKPFPLTQGEPESSVEPVAQHLHD